MPREYKSRGSVGNNRQECSQKRRYATYSAAKKAARDTHTNTDDRVHPFPCAVCGGWHVGSVFVGAIEREAQRRRRQQKHQTPTRRQAEDVLDEYGGGNVRIRGFSE